MSFFTFIRNLFSPKSDPALIAPPPVSVPQPVKDILVELPQIKPLSHPWQAIIIHHSLTADNTTVEWDAIKRYHMQEKGWRDIGYHWGLEKVGTEYVYRTGRSMEQDGAHAKDFNKRGIGICLVGNYDLADPHPRAWEMLKTLCKKLMSTFQIPAIRVIGHRETYILLKKPVEKTCPGSRFDLERLRKELL